MKNKTKKSNCCNAEIKVGGMGDFNDKDKVVTQYYICQKCGKPCDIKPIKNMTNKTKKYIGLAMMMPMLVFVILGIYIIAKSLIVDLKTGLFVIGVIFLIFIGLKGACMLGYYLYK